MAKRRFEFYMRPAHIAALAWAQFETIARFSSETNGDSIAVTKSSKDLTVIDTVYRDPGDR